MADPFYPSLSDGHVRGFPRRQGPRQRARARMRCIGFGDSILEAGVYAHVEVSCLIITGAGVQYVGGQSRFHAFERTVKFAKEPFKEGEKTAEEQRKFWECK